MKSRQHGFPPRAPANADDAAPLSIPRCSACSYSTGNSTSIHMISEEPASGMSARLLIRMLSVTGRDAPTLARNCARVAVLILDFSNGSDDRSALFVNLLRKVVLVPHLFDFVQLRLDPVDVLFLVHGNMLQQLPRYVVAGFEAGFDPGLENFQRRVLQRQVVLQLLLHRRTDQYLVVASHIGSAFEK